MKRLMVCCLYVVLLIGCQSSSRSKSGVEVTIKGEGGFPAELAGVWKSDKGPFEIVFEPDGGISSAVFYVGKVRMEPGRVTEVPARLGGKGTFVPGIWTVDYDTGSRELQVRLAIEHFHMDMGTQAMEGKDIEIFVGPVSEDGRTWATEWYHFPEFIAFTPERHELPYDFNDNPGRMVFTKVSSGGD